MKTKLVVAAFLAAGLATLSVTAVAQPPVDTRPRHSPDQPSPDVGPRDVLNPMANGDYFRSTGPYSTRPANADPAARKLHADESDLARQTDELMRQLAAAKGDSDKEKIKGKLSEALEKQFDVRQQRHALEIAALEAQLKRLQEMVQKRQEGRRDIVAKRLDQLVREAQGLGW
jgi:hypothetical protein